MLHWQILMNASAQIQTSVILTPRVTTLKDPTRVAVLMDIGAMAKTAQVNVNAVSFPIR